MSDFEALVAPAGPYSAVSAVARTGSTNADLLAAAEQGAPDRTVRIAGQQDAGRGRQARQWVSPPGGGLYLSVLLRPAGVPPDRLGSLSLVAGLALVRACRDTAGVEVTLKWPNDLLGPSGGKCAGVLAEVGKDGAVVVGIGLNVDPLPGQVPPAAGGLPATSLVDEGAAVTDLDTLTHALLTSFADVERTWRAAGGDLAEAGLLAEYREACSTLGGQVRVELPGGEELTGTATDVDGLGRLVVGGSTVSAGDVVHLRAAR